MTRMTKAWPVPVATLFALCACSTQAGTAAPGNDAGNPGGDSGTSGGDAGGDGAPGDASTSGDSSPSGDSSAPGDSSTSGGDSGGDDSAVGGDSGATAAAPPAGAMKCGGASFAATASSTACANYQDFLGGSAENCSALGLTGGAYEVWCSPNSVYVWARFDGVSIESPSTCAVPIEGGVANAPLPVQVDNEMSIQIRAGGLRNDVEHLLWIRRAARPVRPYPSHG